MAHHYYTRYLEILKRWPVDEPRSFHCFGKYLRDSSSKWFTLDGRVIGSSEVCARRLQSLERLADDYYRQKYPAQVKSVTCMDVDECRKILADDCSGIISKVLSKLSLKPPKSN